MAMPFNPLIVFTEVNRFDAFRKAREESSVSQATMFPIWSVLRYEDCVSVLKAPEQFSSDPSLALTRNRRQGGDPMGMAKIFEQLPPFMQHMTVTKDPPDHTRLRSLITRAFTPKMIAALEPRIEELADSILAEIEPGSPFDLMENFAIPFPIYVIAEILGVDPSLRTTFKRWSNRMVLDPTATMFMNVGSTPDTAWVSEFTSYFNNLFAERRRRPKDDLVTQLVQLEEAGEKMDAKELMAMCAILLVAGNETTTNWIGNALVALTENPDSLRALEQEPRLIPAAMEEVLRYYSPVQSLFRFAKKGATVGGKEIPEGETVLVWLQSAHRDPSVFEEPDRLDIRREPNRHIAFGSGIHFCIGAPLARLEVKVAMPKLLSRLPGLHRASSDPVRFRKSIMLYGPERVPLISNRMAA